MSNTVIGILAHVDSGKTTLTESILYSSGQINKLGRVDHGDSFLDNNSLERKRGITIFSKQANFTIGKRAFTILDTPGHVDFSPEMERTLQVLDYAILLISGSEGIQTHTENLWELLKRHNIPCFIFVNKMDIARKSRAETLAELKENLTVNIFDFSENSKDTNTSNSQKNNFQNTNSNNFQNTNTLETLQEIPTISDLIQEDLALTDDFSMKEYLENGSLSNSTIKKLIDERKVFPCYFGSALKSDGIASLMRGLSCFANKKHNRREFSAKVFKIMRDAKGTRLTYVKILGGVLKVKDELEGIDSKGNKWKEKINEIRDYSGSKYDSPKEVSSGKICALVGLTNTSVGDTLGGQRKNTNEIFEPVMTYTVNILSGEDSQIAYKHLKELEEEEPKLYVNWSSQQNAIEIQLMGLVQLEIIKNLLNERYNLDVEFSKGNIIYKETISKKAYGVGHFEPLKHYAEVHLLLEPTGIGSGLTFALDCPEDELDVNWQRLILSHLKEISHRGVLINSEITDMKITVVGGRAHKKHTEGGDFREATYRALRQGLAQGAPILLEPWYEFKAKIGNEHIGRFMSDVDKLKGKCSLPKSESDNTTIIEGKGSVKAFNSYQLELNNYSKGTGTIFFKQGNYQPCLNQEEIISTFDYDFELDSNNPADSVFCEKGKGYTVKWNLVHNFMHVESREKRHSDKENEIKKRVMDYKETLVSDKELTAIFERTYGPITHLKNKYSEKKVITKSSNIFSNTTVSSKSSTSTNSTTSENSTISTNSTTPENSTISTNSKLTKIQRKQNSTIGKSNISALSSQEEFLLIDGYNLIYKWEELRELLEVDYGSARDKLIDIISNYAGINNYNVIIVFDAYKVKNSSGSVSKTNNISIVYTKTAETADMYIEKTTFKIGKKYKVRVVTSDTLEQIIITGHGAMKISCESFIEEVRLVEEKIREFLM